jgi:hypothetical protein
MTCVRDGRQTGKEEHMNYVGFDSYHQVRLRNEEMVRAVQTLRLEHRLRATSERRATRFVALARRGVVSLLHKAEFAR